MNAHGLRMLLPLAAALSLAGAGVATYLTVVHYLHQPIACSGLGDCEYVNSSSYAELGGLPVALLGAAAYFTIVALAVVAWLRMSSLLVLAAWGVALASFGFSMYLTYIELWVLEAICVYCVISAGIVTLLLAVLSACMWMVRDDLLGEDERLPGEDEPAADRSGLVVEAAE